MPGWPRFYDIVAKVLFFGREGKFRRTILEQAQLAPGETVLDVGCGTCTLAIAAKERAGPSSVVHGIDATPGMIEVAERKARKAGADVRFQVGLIEKIPFPDGTFDLVLSSLMLHHLPEELQKKGLEEIRRVLKPGGRFLGVDFAGGSHSALGHVLPFLHHKPDTVHAEQLAELLKAGHFDDVVALPTPYRLFAFTRASRT